MNRFKDYKNLVYTFAPTDHALALIKKFYLQMNASELDYYLNTKSENVEQHLANGIVEQKDFELGNLLNYYILACENSMKNLNAEYIKFPVNTQVCITKYKFYLDDIFSLGNVIFITEESLIKLYYMSVKDYNKISEVLIHEDKIYDKEFASKLFSSLLYICQGQNLSAWMEKIYEKFEFDIIFKSESSIRLDKNITVYRNPNTEFASNFYMRTNFNGKKYITLDVIFPTECKYNPYVEPTLFEVETLDGKLIFKKLHKNQENEAYQNMTGNIFVKFVERITSLIFS